MPFKKMIKAVIFDMDGTMFNTEKLWGDVTRKLTERYDITWDEDVRTQMMGKKDSEALAILKDYFRINASVKELIAARREMVLEDLSLVKINEGLLELLDLLDQKGIKKAIATSSFKEFTTRLLAQFDLTARFDTIVTGDDVAVSKPDPAMFLRTAELIQEKPVECLVLEDAQNGVEAAYNAGMRVFAIPHDASRHHDFSKADKILSSMSEIDEDLLQ